MTGFLFRRRFFWMAAILLWVAGCRGPALHVEPIAESRDPRALLSRFAKDIQAARNDEVHLLAPVWYAKAESSLQAAEETLAAGQAPMDALSRGRAQLLAARDASQIARALMPAVMENRRLARKAGAVDLGADYQRVEDAFRKTVRNVEAGRTEPAVRNRQSLAEAFSRLELQAIEADAISDIRRLLLQAERGETTEVAPRSYRRALEHLERTESFITGDRYNTTEIRRLAGQARFYAQRHLEIAAQCRAIEDQPPETLILSFENDLHRIAKELNAPDLRNRPLDLQVENILGAIAARQYERKSALAEPQQQVQTPQSRNTGLIPRPEAQRRDEKRIREHYRQVAALFDPREASLQMRQGRIVIRLRAMEFAVGQSEVLPENAALLAKVGRALSLIEDFDVIIEGHTDNVGSESVNEKLSERRAEAVRHYLVMNENLPYDRMIAIGFGATRPLTTNATESGRAVNRRIDLIVIPHKTGP